MPRSKFLIVLALLLLLTVPVTVVVAQTPAFGEGTAVVFDDAAVSDGIEVSLMGVTVPPAGKEYVAWLVEDEQVGFLNLGTVMVDADGNASLTFGSDSTDYSGSNLVATYSGWAISIEDAGSSPAAPANRGEVSEVIAPATIGELRTLVNSLASLRVQLMVAATHANLATNAETMEGVTSHLRHTINILEGSAGANYDTSHADPGDGTGVVVYAAAAQAAAMAAGAGVEEGSALAIHSATAQTSAANAEMWATMARDVALNALSQDNIALAKIFVGPGGRTVISLIDAAMNGFDSTGNTVVEVADSEGGAVQAYREAQLATTLTAMRGGLPDIATPTPVPTAIPTATPEPEPEPTPIQPTAPGLPGVGGESASLILLLSMLAAAALLGIGGVLSIRGRRARNRA